MRMGYALRRNQESLSSLYSASESSRKGANMNFIKNIWKVDTSMQKIHAKSHRWRILDTFHSQKKSNDSGESIAIPNLGYMKLVRSTPSRYSCSICGWYSRICFLEMKTGHKLNFCKIITPQKQHGYCYVRTSLYISSLMLSFVRFLFSNSNSSFGMGRVDGSCSIFVKLKKYGSAKACNKERKISLIVWTYLSLKIKLFNNKEIAIWNNWSF